MGNKGSTVKDFVELLREEQDLSPLHHAMFAEAKERAVHINGVLDMGFDVNTRSKTGMTALHMAAGLGDHKTARLLASRGANVNAGDLLDFTPLHVAIIYGTPEVMETLIECGADLSSRHSSGFRTPIHSIIETGDIRKLRRFLDMDWTGICPLLEDGNGATALHYAALKEHIDMVKLLLKEGSLVDARTNDGLTPLHLAIQAKSLPIVKCLVGEGADTGIRNIQGWSLLQMAVASECEDIVKYLINKVKVDVNQIDHFLISPLHLAAAHTNINIVKLLLAKGANIDALDDNGSTPLCYNIVNNGSLEIFFLLCDKGSNLNIKLNETNNTPLHKAVEEASVEKVIYMLTKQPEVDALNNLQRTALHFASAVGNLEISRALLAAHATLDRADEYGNTPMLYAAMKGHLQLVKLFGELGADVNRRNADGLTPLLGASLCKDSPSADIVSYLLEKGADVNVKSNEGRSPLHLAVVSDLPTSVKALCASKAEVDAKDVEGCTPLFLATEKRVSKQIISVLLEAGADITVKSAKGSTPFREAARAGDQQTAELLLAAGADVEDEQDGESALCQACRNGHWELVNRLLQLGADPMRSAAGGKAPIHLASENGHADICKALLRASVDVNRKDHQGSTALAYAAMAGDLAVMIVLLKGGACADAPAKDGGSSILKAASKRGHTAVVKLLVEHGATVNTVVNGELCSPALIAACEKGYTSVVKALLDKNASLVGGMPINSKCVDCRKIKYTPMDAAKYMENHQVVRLLESRIQSAKKDISLIDLASHLNEHQTPVEAVCSKCGEASKIRMKMQEHESRKGPAQVRNKSLSVILDQLAGLCPKTLVMKDQGDQVDPTLLGLAKQVSTATIEDIDNKWKIIAALVNNFVDCLLQAVQSDTPLLSFEAEACGSYPLGLSAGGMGDFDFVLGWTGVLKYIKSFERLGSAEEVTVLLERTPDLLHYNVLKKLFYAAKPYLEALVPKNNVSPKGPYVEGYSLYRNTPAMWVNLAWRCDEEHVHRADIDLTPVIRHPDKLLQTISCTPEFANNLGRLKQVLESQSMVLLPTSLPKEVEGVHEKQLKIRSRLSMNSCDKAMYSFFDMISPNIRKTYILLKFLRSKFLPKVLKVADTAPHMEASVHEDSVLSSYVIQQTLYHEVSRHPEPRDWQDDAAIIERVSSILSSLKGGKFQSFYFADKVEKPFLPSRYLVGEGAMMLRANFQSDVEMLIASLSDPLGIHSPVSADPRDIDLGWNTYIGAGLNPQGGSKWKKVGGDKHTDRVYVILATADTIKVEFPTEDYLLSHLAEMKEQFGIDADSDLDFYKVPSLPDPLQFHPVITRCKKALLDKIDSINPNAGAICVPLNFGTPSSKNDTPKVRHPSV